MKLELSIAIGDYDRTRPLIDGAVQIDGVNPLFLTLAPEEIFFRAFRHADFDVCELSLSSFALRTARADNPYVGVPVFPSRAFRHTAIVVRTDRGIRAPGDLKGRRIGTPEYQLTACVWARALLREEFGLSPSDVIWVRGGMEQPGRLEKIDLDLPASIRLESAPPDRTLSELLERGDIDGIVGPRLPSCFGAANAPVGWLFPDPTGAAMDYFRRTGIFPIMHLLGVRRALAERHPWVPATLAKAFEQAKSVAWRRLRDTSATKVMLPFIDEQVYAARRLLGEDPWPYGLEANRKTLETFLNHHHEQGLSPRPLGVEELFHPATLEAFKI
ncbi:MAG TPA: ABC transporter substrate-binding protein [Steroidobacteraceae bacterium]|nr:ABC transporter substrate-binding protein [Steroidobacteraceae bacterium]